MALSLPPTLNPQRLMAWLSVALVLAAVVWWLAPVLTPFVVAAILAYALQPLVRRLQGVLGVRVPAFVSVVLVELLGVNQQMRQHNLGDQNQQQKPKDDACYLPYNHERSSHTRHRY